MHCYLHYGDPQGIEDTTGKSLQEIKEDEKVPVVLFEKFNCIDRLDD